MIDLCDTKVYQQVERQRHFWEYNSERHNGDWPPSVEQLMSLDLDLLCPTVTEVRALPEK
jgi:hypothetical protein